jgi:hypothetical protein
MTRKFRSVVAACAFAGACGSGGTHGNQGVDGGGGGDGQGTVDAATDAPSGLPTGVYAIPLGTPTGADQGSFYTATLTASGNDFLLDLDTGSTVTGIAGASCMGCTGMSPLYSPGAGATATGKTDSASYADGSSWSGSVYTDTVGLHHGTFDVEVNFVDITKQKSFFSGNEYQGILGMGPDALLDPGTTAYFDQEVSAGVTSTMAFELCPTAGTMWLGGYDATHAAAAMQYTPILTSGVNNGFYAVNMTGISLDATSLGATSATLDGPIVDTGTSLFYIPSAAETKLISTLNNNAAFKTLFPNQTLTDPTNSSSQTAGCVNAAQGTTQTAIDHMLPTLKVTFAGMGGGTITLDAPALASYFYDAGGGQYCLAIYGGGDQGNATMGDTFLRAFVTVVDTANGKVGFAPTSSCPAPYIDVPRGPLREHGRGPHHALRAN